ncbi:FAD-dependent thymidylate synthase [Terracidiphilus gabretensis]|jgi:thymidylate synthase ThyX|uniref:FAD-dependent thymidylate synthase n=1 Tax=Terracidiphilus gabretensis TaxID=1577687 RepID=UPI00071BB6A9|nr:FAD-dependent thymidylate synthase [Terracidiphilus gabretensis]
MSSESLLSAGVVSQAQNQTDVYAVHGADPEVLAYAMAKYSRSALSMKESLKEISSQRAEQFLNTFYFQYGHRSIADLAHIAFAIERLSLLAAIVLVDEQRWDGQERSTRYQNFLKSGWYLPDFGEDSTARQLYAETVDGLFVAYERTTTAVQDALRERVERPDEMKPDAYERTLKARAFDVARYLLPLATNTSLGQIVNARTLETQVSRLLSSPLAEVRELGQKLKDAAAGAAWNPNSNVSADEREVRVAPTLVKYAEASSYQIETKKELAAAAASILSGVSIADAPVVDLVERTETLEVELAATLLYSASHYPYRQVRDVVAALPGSRVLEIIELGLKHRGRHDEALRAFHSGAALRFDVLMDIGGFRDMHRHRRVTQIMQDFTARHGYDVPETGDAAGLAEAGIVGEYRAAVERAFTASGRIAAGKAPEAAQSAKYLLPLATRVRCLFKMDFAEAQYISELRSGPAGHFSYRRVAWEMYVALERQHPALAKYIRVTDFTQPIDLLKR